MESYDFIFENYQRSTHHPLFGSHLMTNQFFVWVELQIVDIGCGFFKDDFFKPCPVLIQGRTPVAATHRVEVAEIDHQFEIGFTFYFIFEFQQAKIPLHIF